MAEYQTKSSDFLSFDLTKDGKSIGKLAYKSWFKFDAVILIANYTSYQVEPKGFWSSTIELREREKLLLKFQMNWNGEIVLETFFGDSEKGYVFKHKGVFKESFVLTDHEGTELVVMKPHLKWALLNYEYVITTTDLFEDQPNKEILLMTSIHCANYYMSMIANYSGA